MNRIRTLWIIFLVSVAAALLPGTAAAADETDVTVIMETAKQAVSLMERGQFQSAYDYIMAVYPLYKDDNNLNFLLGQCSFALKKNAEAIHYYQAILARSADSPRVRLELGRAYAANGQTAAAKQEFTRVLATGPPPVVADNVRKYMAALDSQQKVHIRTATGFTYDSNVNAGPDNIIYKNNWTVDWRKRSDHAITTGVYVDYFDPYSATAAWQGSLSVSSTDYLHEKDLSWSDINLFAGHLNKGEGRMLSLGVAAKHTLVGGSPYSFSVGLAPQLQWQLTDNRTLTAALSVLHREFYTNPQRNGPSYALSLAERWGRGGGDPSFIELGAGYTKETSETSNLASRALNARLTYYVRLPNNFGLLIQPGVTWYRYGGTDPYSESIDNNPRGRRDIQRNMQISLTKTVNDWSYVLGYGYTANRSNIDGYRYNRTQVSLQAYRNW